MTSLEIGARLGELIQTQRKLIDAVSELAAHASASTVHRLRTTSDYMQTAEIHLVLAADDLPVQPRRESDATKLA